MTSEVRTNPTSATRGRRAAGPFGAFVDAPVIGLAVIVVAIVPLVPRPTTGGNLALIAPLVGAALAYLAAIEGLTARSRGRRMLPGALVVSLVIATGFYSARVVWLGQGEELQFAVSRILLVGVICAAAVLAHGGREELVLRGFAYGVVVLGLLVAVIGFTGLHVLEAPLPARTLGVRLPWFKTAGVPRSFGEQGIILSVALAYYLVNRKRLPLVLRVGLPIASVVIVAMGQSRNILLAAVVVLGMWYLVVRPGRWLLAGATLVACGVATLVVEQLLPIFARTSLGGALIGEGIFQRNVEARFGLVSGAIELVRQEPLRALIGWQHADWRQFGLTDYDVGVHNHVASSMLFLGVIAGSVTLWVILVRPLHRILAVLAGSAGSALGDRGRTLVVAAAGILVSLNFYEGFFSLTLGIFVGLMWAFLVDLKRHPTAAETRAATRAAERSAP